MSEVETCDAQRRSDGMCDYPLDFHGLCAQGSEYVEGPSYADEQRYHGRAIGNR